MRPSASLALGLLVSAAAAVVPAAAQAAPTSSDYIARSVTPPASQGLPVAAPLDEFRAVARIRVIVPERWTVQRAPAGRLRFLTPGVGCRYQVTFSVRPVIAAPGDPSARVNAQLVPPSTARLLDEGRRVGSAYRVTRPVTTDGTVSVRGLRSAVLTRRTDIVPAGQVAWADLTASARSRPGDECHSGTYRQTLGPQLGDALATARTTLGFARRPR
jgi:hypothetical protein